MTPVATLGQVPLNGSGSHFPVIAPAFVQGALPARRELGQLPQSDADCIKDIVQMSSRGAAYTLDLARLMSQTRASRSYGAWSALCRSKELPFKKRKAEMLARIGDALGQADAHICAHLPCSLRALYYIAGLGCSLVERLVGQGKIHPGLRWEEAKELLAQYKPQGRKKKPQSNVERRLTRFAAFLQATLAQWSIPERRLAETKVLPLLQKCITAPLPAMPDAHVCAHLPSSLPVAKGARKKPSRPMPDLELRKLRSAKVKTQTDYVNDKPAKLPTESAQ